MELYKRNNALRQNTNTVNGRTADIAITTRGSDFYFAICGAMGAAALIFIGMSYMKHRRDRIFHYITAAIVFVAAIAYFTMGSNLGFTPIAVQFSRRNPRVRGRYREIFYVRYIDWFITTPLLLLDLLLTAGLPWPTILWVMLVDWIMIVCGLVGALITSRYKWAYFAFGCAALFYIIYQLAWQGPRHAVHYGNDCRRTFLMCGTLTLIVWVVYPVAWGVCEGGNYIAPDSEAIFYGVLDFLAKILFGALLLWGHRGIEPARLGLAIRDYDDDPSVGPATGGKYRHENYPDQEVGAVRGHQTDGRTTIDPATDVPTHATAHTTDGVANIGTATVGTTHDNITGVSAPRTTDNVGPTRTTDNATSTRITDSATPTRTIDNATPVRTTNNATTTRTTNNPVPTPTHIV